MHLASGGVLCVRVHSVVKTEAAIDQTYNKMAKHLSQISSTFERFALKYIM